MQRLHRQEIENIRQHGGGEKAAKAEPADQSRSEHRAKHHADERNTGVQAGHGNRGTTLIEQQGEQRDALPDGQPEDRDGGDGCDEIPAPDVSYPATSVWWLKASDSWTVNSSSKFQTSADAPARDWMRSSSAASSTAGPDQATTPWSRTYA